MYATPREDWDPSIFFVKSLGKTGGSDVFFFSVGILVGAQKRTPGIHHFDMYKLYIIIYILALSFEMHFIFERYIH